MAALAVDDADAAVAAAVGVEKPLHTCGRLGDGHAVQVQSVAGNVISALQFPKLAAIDTWRRESARGAVSETVSVARLWRGWPCRGSDAGSESRGGRGSNATALVRRERNDIRHFARKPFGIIVGCTGRMLGADALFKKPLSHRDIRRIRSAASG
jgi:hypothetical protein